MHTLTMLAHLSGRLHIHAEGVTFIILGIAMVVLCLSWKKTVCPLSGVEMNGEKYGNRFQCRELV